MPKVCRLSTSMNRTMDRAYKEVNSINGQNTSKQTMSQ